MKGSETVLKFKFCIQHNTQFHKIP